MAVSHVYDYLFLLFCMLGISYTHRGLLCEGLSSQDVDGGYALFESIPDDKEYSDTNPLNFLSNVLHVFGIRSTKCH